MYDLMLRVYNNNAKCCTFIVSPNNKRWYISELELVRNPWFL